MKNLELEKAKSAYANGNPEVKQALEAIFGVDALKQDVSGETDIYKNLNCKPEEDVIKISGFDEGQHNFLKNIVKKMRVCEFYNGRKKLKLGEKRYFDYYYTSGSGLVFDHSTYDDDLADASSAARLSFARKADLEAAREKFPTLDIDIFDLQ